MSNEIAKKPKNIADVVLAKVQGMEKNAGLKLPADYSAGNALNSAYLKLQEVKTRSGAPVLEACTPASISLALLDMVIQGLNPAKNQCYFIAYGKELTLLRSYMGTVTAAKRFGNVKNVFGQVVYADDSFEYEIDPATGVKSVTKHEQTLKNTEGKIIAAYATVLLSDGTKYQEIMTIDEIQKAWAQGSGYGKSKTHTNFKQEMCKKTVINRACKLFVNTSSDDGLLAESYNHTTENEYKNDEAIEATYEVTEDQAEAEAMLFGNNKSDSIEADAEPLTDEELEKQRMAKEIIENEQIDSTGLSDAEKAEIEAQDAKEAEEAE